MKAIVYLLIILLFSCTDSSFSDTNNESETKFDTEEYGDGTWCADVEYYNSNTGTRNTYTLDVEVENGELAQINWPNGGWLDESHFSPVDISDGECSFTSDKGYEYSITLTSKGGGCGSSDGFRMQNEIEEDIADITCPVCGAEKETYESECYRCKQKKETCPKCYGFKMEWNELCDDCQDDERKSEDGEDF